jgi:hypothetical protein
VGDDTRGDDRLRAERRAFLEQCGRFAVVTPPAVTLMLTVSDKAVAAASGRTTGTTTTTVTTTGPTAPTLGQKTFSPSGPPEQLAMKIDSLGLMRL